MAPGPLDSIARAAAISADASLALIAVPGDSGPSLLGTHGFAQGDPAAATLANAGVDATAGGAGEIELQVGQEDGAAVPARLASAAEAAGVSSLMTVPIRVDGGRCGTLVVGARAARTWYEADRETLRALAAAAGTHIDLRRALGRQRRAAFATQLERDAAQRAQERAESSARRAAFLGAVASISDGAPTLHGALRRLTRRLVPALADWAVAYAVNPDGTLRHAGSAHVRPEDLPHVRRIDLRVAGEALPPEWVARALQRRDMLHLDDLGPRELDEAAPGEAAREALHALAPRAILVLPLVTEDSPSAVLLLALSHSGSRFGDDEVALASEMAGRAAAALNSVVLRDAAVAASRAKSDFLAVMSHELRTPLNAILGYTELLRLGIPEQLPSGSLEHVARVRAGGMALLRTIEEILTFARMESGRESVQPAPVDLRQLVEEVVADLEPLAANKSLTVRSSLPGERVLVDTDAGKVRQILFNLIDNAVKFTPAGEVTVELEAGEDDVVLRVCDTGIGIAPEHQERIFEAFWQVEQATTRRAGGTGLGLAVVRRLTDLLGGHLTLSSEEDHGCSIQVRLPRELHGRGAGGRAQSPG